jgi:hypothetical protein
MNKAESEYQDAVESRSVLINQKAAEYLANPSERHGFIVKQVYPTNQQQVIRSMAEQGYMVHRVGMLPLFVCLRTLKIIPYRKLLIKLQQRLNQPLIK